jgi:hypothetical protein
MFTGSSRFLETVELMKKRVPKTISIDPGTLSHGMERAAQFKLTFSRHVERLIEEDYLSGKTKIVIVAEPRPKDEHADGPDELVQLP